MCVFVGSLQFSESEVNLSRNSQRADVNFHINKLTNERLFLLPFWLPSLVRPSSDRDQQVDQGFIYNQQTGSNQRKGCKKKSDDLCHFSMNSVQVIF